VSSRAGTVARLRSAGCVFAEDEARLLTDAAADPAELEHMVSRREAGSPVEHIVGWAEFCGLRIVVGPGVFVPRRRTERLAHEAVVVARRLPHPAVVVDLCCGSGAVATALGAMLDEVELHAVDVDPTAVACARRNLAGVGGQVYAGDLYEPLPTALRGRVDLLVANAPYVPTDEIALMPPEARLHEPQVSLDGGVDGLDIVSRIIEGAPSWLAPGGALLVESSEPQVPELVWMLSQNGLAPQGTGSVVIGSVVIGRGSP